MPSKAMIALKPVFDAGQEADFARQDLQGTLYFMSSGLKRRFFYQSPHPKSLDSETWKKVESIPQIALESIMVKLPKEADVFERNTATLAAAVEQDTPSGRIKIYSQAKLSSPTTGTIDIVYQVPPTKQQTQTSDYVLKFFSALIVPFVALILLSSDKVKAPRTRRIALWILAIVELIILAGLLWWAFKIQSVAGSSALFEVGLAGVSAISTALVAYVKGEG